MKHPPKHASQRNAPRWFAIACAVLLGAGTTLTGNTAALAAVWTYNYWPCSVCTPGAASYGFDEYDYDYDWLHLVAAPLTLASGKCYDELFDWGPEVSGSHYDSRMARSCKSNTDRDTQVSHEAPHDVKPPNKIGTCYGLNYQENVPYSNCRDVIPSTANINVNTGPGNFCTRAWTMTFAGVLQYYNAGNPLKCDS